MVYLISLDILISLIIIYKSKYSILSIISLLANYPIFPLVWEYYYNKGASSLSSPFGLQLYMTQMLLGILIFNIINLYFVFFTDILKKEENMLNFKQNMIFNERLIFVLLATVSLLISMPTLPFTHVSDFSQVRKALVAGSAWNYLMICSMVAFLSSTKKITLFEGVFLGFIFAWSLGNFNRAEVIGLFVLLGLRYVSWEKISKKRKWIFFTMALIGIIFMMFLGYYRVQESAASEQNILISFILDIKNQIIHLTNQNTAGDIIHIYNTAFHYTREFGFLYGKSYLMYIYSILPFTGGRYNNEYLFTNILQNRFYNLGGGYFLTEPYINFGYVGIAVYSLLFFILLKYIVKKPNFISYMYYGVFVSAIFRLQWYGMIYIERSFIQIIPFILLLQLLIRKVFKNSYKSINEVCIIGQFPPPMHGLSKAVETLYNSELKEKYKFGKVDITSNKKILSNILKLLTSNCELFYITIAQSKFGNLRDMIMIILLKLRGKKVLIHLHGGYYRELYDKVLSKIQKNLNKLVLSKIDGAIVLGESLKYIFEGLVPEEKIFTVYNCVDDQYILSQEDFDKKIEGIKSCNTLNILYLSNFIETKGYKEVLQLAKMFRDNKIESVNFNFAGKFFIEEDEKYFNNFVQNNNLQTYIHYKGIVDGEEKKKLLNESHVFILPTRYEREGQPISIIEAMGNGMAIITTKHAGIPDLVTDNQNGYLIKYDNINRLYDAIKLLSEDKSVLKKIAENNRQKVKANFLEKHYINNLDKVFKEVLQYDGSKQIQSKLV